MWPQLAASLFGGSLLGWLSHALYIRPQQLKGAPAAVSTGVQAVENGLIQPLVTGIAGQAIQSAAAGQPVTLPSGTAIGNAVTTAALAAIQSALTGPHTIAPAAAPATKAVAPTSAPAASSDDASADSATTDTGAPPMVSATF